MKKRKSATGRKVALQWSFFIFGLIVLALGISLTIQAKDLGIGPWDVFHYGLWLKFGLTIGTWSIIAGFFIILIGSIYQKKWPQVGTYLNMILIGLFIDFFNLFLPSPESLFGQIVMLLTGLVVLGYGIGIYVSADLGAGPRDSLMLMLTEITGWKVEWVRNGIEVLVLIMGWLLGGPVGLGTVIIAFGIGPIVGISLRQSKYMLNLLTNRGDRRENINERPIRVDHYDGTCEEAR